VREIDSRHQERMAAIEKGLELPPEPHVEAAQMAPRARYLLRGLIWLGVGLAITFGGRNWLQAPTGDPAGSRSPSAPPISFLFRGRAQGSSLETRSRPVW